MKIRRSKDSYSTFIGTDPNHIAHIAQLKVFFKEDWEMSYFKIGDAVPVAEYGFPQTCTFCEWGGTSQLFRTKNILGEYQNMGIFVIIKDGRLLSVTIDETEILFPVYSKYGELLEKEEE